MTVPLSFLRQHSLPQPLIVVLDSLGWQRRDAVARIRAFLAAEWEVKERRKYPGIEPDFSEEGVQEKARLQRALADNQGESKPVRGRGRPRLTEAAKAAGLCPPDQG